MAQERYPVRTGSAGLPGRPTESATLADILERGTWLARTDVESRGDEEGREQLERENRELRERLERLEERLGLEQGEGSEETSRAR